MGRHGRQTHVDRHIQKDQTALLRLLRHARRKLNQGALGRNAAASKDSDDDIRRHHDRYGPPSEPPRPEAVGSDWTDRSISGPPRRTFDLVLRNRTESKFAATGGPPRRLTALAASVVAEHLDEYDQTFWNDSAKGVPIELARHVVCELQNDQSRLDRAAWVTFVGSYGPGVLPTRASSLMTCPKGFAIYKCH